MWSMAGWPVCGSIEVFSNKMFAWLAFSHWARPARLGSALTGGRVEPGLVSRLPFSSWLALNPLAFACQPSRREATPVNA
jgi:hypothetical protein